MDDSLETMLADGTMELAGVDESGEPLYRMNAEVCKRLHPKVFHEQWGSFLANVNELWQLGYVDLSWDEDEDMVIHLNEKSHSPGDDLSDFLKNFLAEMIIVLGE